MPFEWDAEKATSNLFKHGVSFEEASTVFADYFALTYADAVHSHDENREITLGMSSVQRVLLVVSTYRGDNTRIISARKPTPSERTFYEKQFK